MKIAQVAPFHQSVPPSSSCGTERVVAYLTEELVRRGHEVTLFSFEDLPANAKLVPRDLRNDVDCPEPPSDDTRHARTMEMVFRDTAGFDILHFHSNDLHALPLGRCPCPSITTLHGWLHAPDSGPLLSAYSDRSLVSVSNAQRRLVPGANWQATVYPGLPRDQHFLRERPGQYLAFVGDKFPDDRVDRAVEIAREAGMKLKIAAADHFEERAYREQMMESLPRKSRRWIEFVGELDARAKDEFLGNARALIFPVDWSEPFGMVMIEAMACGTPVIGWRNGSVPEVIAEGVTGFVVDNVHDAVRAVGRVADLDRRACRERFKQCFDASRMALDYLHLYRQAALAG